MRQRLSILRVTGLGVAAVATLALAGCKDGQGAAQAGPSNPGSASASQPAQSPGSTAPSSPSTGGGGPAKGAGKTELTVTVRKTKTAKASTYKLGCDPTSGNLPKADQACAALDTAAATRSDPFKPTPKGQMCTDIYGGPETASVTGTWQGKPVKADFNRKNGCEITRWSKLAPLFS